VGYGSGIALSLVTVALTLRHLGVTDAGRLFAGLSALTLALALSDLGLAGLGLRDYATAPPEARASYLGDLVTVRSLFFVVAAGPAVALAMGGIGHEPALVLGLLAAAAAFLGTVLATTASIPFAERLDTTTQALVQVGQSAAALGTTAVLVAANAGLPWFFGVQLPGIALALALLRWRGTGPNPWPRFRRLRPALGLVDRATLVLGAAVILGVAFYRVGPLAVAYLAGDHEAGLYGSAFRIADVLESVAPLLMMVVLPVLAVQDGGLARFQARVGATLHVMAPLGALAGAGAYGAAGLVVRVLGGPQYDGSVRVLEVLSGMLVLAYPCQVYGYALLATRRHSAMLGSVAAALVVSGTTAFALAPSAGAVGAAVALVAGQAALLLGYLLAYRHEHRIGPHAGVVLFSAVAYLFSVTVCSQVPGLWWRAAVAVALAGSLAARPTYLALRAVIRTSGG
jgi:O-antigen/teichoic acid export membrane protein